MSSAPRDLSVGLLWRGDPAAPVPAPADTRLRRIFEGFAARGVAARPVVFAEELAEEVERQLRAMDAVIVWVDPIVAGRDRSVLDALLRRVAASGVFVSAHPDVILAMGTKEVLVRTRDLPWGSDARVYRTLDELRSGFLDVLRRSGPRVLKQDRGSGGNGVWKVELVREAEAGRGAIVRVQPAQRGAHVEEMDYGAFIDQRRGYGRFFAGSGSFVDQPYAERLAEGMTRCYFALDRVAGFGHQLVTALLPPPPGEAGPPDPPPRLYYGPDEPAFRPLRRLVESGWIEQMQDALGVARESLPVIWDADFLLGPKDPNGDDTYLLCEINVSGVFPIPDQSIGPLVEATIERVRSMSPTPGD